MSSTASLPSQPRILLIQAYAYHQIDLPEMARVLARAAAIGFTVKSTTTIGSANGSGANHNLDLLWTLQAEHFDTSEANVKELQEIKQIGTTKHIQVFVA